MTELERFIASQVDPRLASGETIVHSGYLTGAVQAGGPLGAVMAGIGMRACFIALSETRAFFLWNKPGRVGAFRPLLECDDVQVVERRRITAKITRSGLLSHALWVSLDGGEVLSFHLRRKVRSLPGQAGMIDGLCENPMV